MKKNNGIAVVYLARCADGLDAFARFVNSYKNHPAGIDHKLVIIYKGFESSESLEQAKLIFKDVLHDQIFLEDVGFDIGSYFEASKVITSEYLCFLNTHSEISADDWLKLMMQAATKDEIGLTGAMGSYESLMQSWKLIQMFYWLFYMKGYVCPENIYEYYRKFTEYLPVGDLKISRGRGPIMKLKNYYHNWVLARAVSNTFKEFEMHWQQLLMPGKMFEDLATIEKFPNAHIRSNGFLVKNAILKKLNILRIQTKSDACLFESGPQSMTNVIKNLGLKVVIVGKNGTIYDEENWWDSHTFRQGDQSNLLISDNHTRAFMDMECKNKFLHNYLTWGNLGAHNPPDFCELGISFVTRG
ncbi:hypothetical protein [Polynucleobacter sp. JS-Fieb-80-E5]|uniref:hypothetical protein n=1 Tax=Polynucleobacter sp. JS-Fieb-80-E5 TaxID=2081050 RepID=UPI001C0BD837|nr:hypothetical protein [Polynucleobacter sp. JS-Fieb-80-E5]MBU3619953.1 hypothetical protein [Polynucleobacter sp. JS-Fieb-80-E5]